MGLNESAGYLALALTALLTGAIAANAGLRPEPFLLGVAYAALGLGLSTLVGPRDPRPRRPRSHHAAQTADQPSDLTDRQVFTQTSFREPALSSASQAGLVNNLNDGLAWGLFPVLFTSAGLTLGQIGILVALYPAVWGLGQLATGALSDRWGRKHLITAGMLLQAAALAGIAATDTFTAWALASIALGAGTAMVYPTLLASIGDVAHPSWRARAVGVYRLWRDLGFAVGALLTGVLADAFGVRARRSGPSLGSPPPPGSSSRYACTKPTRAKTRVDSSPTVSQDLPFVAAYEASGAWTAMGDPTRLAMIEQLADHPQAVGELAAQLPISRPAVSQHLKVLKEAGLVSERAAGTRRIYRLNPAAVAAMRDQLDTFWSRALAGYTDVVNEPAARAGGELAPPGATGRGADPQNGFPPGTTLCSYQGTPGSSPAQPQARSRSGLGTQ